MRLKLTLIALIIFSNSFAQQKYWRATVHTGEYGLLETNFISEANGPYLYGTSKPEANKRILGGLKGSLAKNMFQKNGSVMELDSLSIKENKMDGYLLMDKRKYYLKGVQSGDTITADIVGKKSDKVYGKLIMHEVSRLEKPKNYVKLWNDIKELTEKFIYNKKALDVKEWVNFVDYMDSFSPKAADDGEFMTAFFYKSRDLPFSHFSLTGNKEKAGDYSIASAMNQTPLNELKPTLKKIDDNILLLDIPAFNFRISAIDSMMNVIINSQAKNLIIDLRENSGGDMEGGMRICQYIANKELFGGVVLAQSYWNSHQLAPDPANYSDFKVMNSANYEWFRNEIKNGVEGLSIVTTPLEKTFTGKIYILTSEKTASSSEPFVYTLQKENIATVIGSKTAGAVVSMEYFNLQNFGLSIPILDYYTSDGKRLDKIGVEPNISCEPKDALISALAKINNLKK